MINRLGVLGGTFDPIHIAHLFMGTLAAEDLSLSKVILMPAGRPPHKQGSSITGRSHRLEMVRAAVRGDPLFEVSDLELSGSAPSYTIETVRQLLERAEGETELYLIIG